MKNIPDRDKSEIIRDIREKIYRELITKDLSDKTSCDFEEALLSCDVKLIFHCYHNQGLYCLLSDILSEYDNWFLTKASMEELKESLEFRESLELREQREEKK